MDKKLYSKLKTCPNCGGKLLLDDLDYSFDGCQDEYYVCENYDVVVTVKVRYKKACKTRAIVIETGEVLEVRI